MIKTSSNKGKSNNFIEKAEHNLNAAIEFEKGNYSDWSPIAFFYSMYHCLLAISAKFGYESRNQECTLALIYNLIEDKKIDFNKRLLDEISMLGIPKDKERSIVDIREFYQYGTSLSIKKDVYKDLLKLAKEVLSRTKDLLEE
ncbi:MAG: HEPN domain-containing protein [Candidatus Woesearchaeota archaeon]